MNIATIPHSLEWRVQPAASHITAGRLEIAAGAKTDLFTDPGGSPPIANSPWCAFRPQGDFMLAARVSVDFRSTFDAGALLVHAGAELYAKLCFEFSPQAEPMIVSVVTHGRSDDCNHVALDRRDAWLRVSRMGDAFAFHYSLDGVAWRMARHFDLDGADVELGFSAQSPTGDGCTATFDAIRFEARRLTGLRTGD